MTATYYEGNFNATGLKLGIVVSRFNDFITEKLLQGAMDTLMRNGAASQNIFVALRHFELQQSSYFHCLSV